MTDRPTVSTIRPARWQPTRAGLIGLWRYADETFTFHNGRLLLRGPNGSGKSMALELLLPFLLDGDSSPSRLTSSGKPRGRLLDRVLAGAAGEQSRTGFAWVEFRRRDEVFTVGARIRGSRSTNKTDVNLFTSTLAVGRELHLLDGTRTPLSVKALQQAIGSTGAVHSTAEDHRAAVRETLYPGFGAERYRSIITALLALRREKLSDRLDPDKLSDVLSDALPPLDDHDIAVVAEGFERLDRRRHDLAALERDVAQLKSLADRQRRYARTAVLTAAATVRSAETNRDEVTRKVREARDELAETESRAEAVRSELEQRAGRLTEIDTTMTALKDSDAYRAGAGMNDLRTHAGNARRQADLARERTAGRRDRRDEAADDQQAADEAAELAAENARRAEQDLRLAADRVGADQLVQSAVEEDQPGPAVTLITAWIDAHRERIGEVRSALDAHTEAARHRDLQDAELARDEEQHEEAEARLAEATTEEEDARIDLAAGVDEWIELSETVGTDRLRALLPAPVREPDALLGAVTTVRTDLSAELAAEGERLDARRATIEDDLAELRREQQRWADSALHDPPAPEWRADREGRPGGPLWRLVDVAPGVEPATVDRLEAALTAAGLIDAWVSPDGQLEPTGDRADLQLTIRPASGGTLLGSLVPATNAAVDGQVLAGVLSSIAVAERAAAADAEVVVGLDGSFRLGSAVGRGPSRPAALLGSAARERRRRQRLTEIDAELAELVRAAEAVDREDELLAQRRRAIDSELAAVPDPSPVRASVAAVATAAALTERASSVVARRRDQRREAEGAVRSALQTLSTLATRHRLPTERERLAEVEQLVLRLRETADTWSRRRSDQATARKQADSAAGRTLRAAADLVDAEHEERDSTGQADELTARLAALESAVGADYRQTLDRLAELTQERAEHQRRVRALDQEDRELVRSVAVLGERSEQAEAARGRAESERTTAQRAFVDRVGALGVDATFDLPGPWDNATAILAAARSLAAAHENADLSPRALEALSQRVTDQLHAAQAEFGARYEIDRELADDGWWTLRVAINGLRRRAVEAVEVLAGQLEQGRKELAAEEEQLFEQTLAGSVRRALAERIRTANALVDAINDQLSVIRTAAAGVGVRLRWQVSTDQPPAVQAARKLLLRDPADLSDEERRSLQDFVRSRVDQARLDPAAEASWETRLRESLDYRSWHEFTLQVAHRDWEGFQPATTSRLQRLSTGERSISLHLPMIAAVAAHYSAEDGTPATCPRLILLDELFAGVDVPNRAQLFGAFTAWQLDAVFTSDHEWCQYRDLDGIAIHYLHQTSDNEPVTTTRFTWDGARRVIDPGAA